MGYETELMNGVCPVYVNVQQQMHAIVVDSKFLKSMSENENSKGLKELMD